MNRKSKFLMGICGFLLLNILCQNVAFAEKDIRAYTYNLSMECVLANPKTLIGKTTRVTGYVHYMDTGMILYYSENDYEYDTKENAVVVEDVDKEYIETCKKYAQEGEYTIKFGTIECVGKDGYAASLKNIDATQRDAFEYANGKPKQLEDKAYDRSKEKEEAENVSIYRLLGDPLRYDGKKMEIEGYKSPGEDMKFRGARGMSTVIYSETEAVNGIFLGREEWERPYQKVVERYRNEGLTEIDYINYVVFHKNLRMHMTCMFYAYENVYEEEEGKMIYCDQISPNYRMLDFTVDEKDMNKFREAIKEISNAMQN